MTTFVLAALPPGTTGTTAGEDATHALQALDRHGHETGAPVLLGPTTLGTLNRIQEQDVTSRIVWLDTRVDYPPLLAAGVRIARCHDLGLAARVLAPFSTTASLIPDRPTHLQPERPSQPGQDSLFAVPAAAGPSPAMLAAEFRRQLALAQEPSPLEAPGLPIQPRRERLWMLAGLDSAGALAAEEMHQAGIPWDASVHEDMLCAVLGPRVPSGTRPVRLGQLTDSIRAALDAPELNPESQPELLRALHRAGLEAPSTRKQDLEKITHPVIADLLEYRKLSRLHAANGWAWLDTWVRQRRFHPTYDVAAVVSGRWGGHGGGVQQLPREIRTAVRADPGHVLVVADASQLEPRVLAAVSADRDLASAAAGRDLYQGIADLAFGGERKIAKVAMLGAMYGGTTGISAEMAPRLARAFPTATAFLESAARTGERGGNVSTWLGRVSPRASPLPDDGDAPTGRSSPAAKAARAQGRFTRNFVVQGSASEWAAAWLATLRTRLYRVAPSAHQVLFLHDEIMVHAANDDLKAVEEAMTASAAEASRLVFGSIPVDFPVDVGHGQDYATAKG